MTRCGRFPHKSYERGNVFAMLFAAVALTGVLAAVGMQTLTGPVSTITRVTQRNVADNNLLMNAKIIVNAAVTAVAGGDSDGDGIIEPAEFVSAAIGETPPTNGGYLPTDLGLALTDPWGTKYGYCVWDHGTTNTSTDRLTGDNTGTASTQAVIALIAAGPDKTFQTTCSAYSGGPVQVTKASGSDDLIFKYSYAEAAASSNGLWTINVSDDAKAELKDSAGSAVNVTIDRDTGIGDFLGLTTSVISAKTDGTIALDGGLLLDADGGGATTCTAAEKGSLRLNTDRDDLELCDGAGGWVEVRTPPGGSAGHVQFNDGADGFAGDANLFWDNSAKRLGVGGSPSTHTLDVTGTLGTSGNASIGGTLGVTGATTLSSTLDVTDAATLSNTLSVSGNATFNTDTLFVDANNDRVGIGTASPSHLLDVTGAADMGALGSLATSDAVLHVDDGTSNLYVDGRAVISDGGFILGTTGAETLQLVTDETQRILIASDGTVSITGNTAISGATSLWSTLTVAGDTNFDSGTLFVDTADDRVGVGTTDPLTKLDVAGGVKIGGDSICNISKAGMVAWNSGVLQLCGADGNWTSLAAIEKLDDIGDVDVPSPNANEVLAWDGTSWVAKNVNLLGPAQMDPAGNDGSVQFREGNDLGADPDYFHWDKDNHRLGTGTATPQRRLHIVGEQGAVPSFPSSGIGGQDALIVENNANSAISIVTGTGGTAGLRFSEDAYGSAGGKGGIFFNLGTGTLSFATNPATSERMRIDGSGLVGIGTTTPQSLLHVAGGIQLGDDTATCPGASNEKLGTLRFNGGNLQVCKSTGWSGVSSGSGSGGTEVSFTANGAVDALPTATWTELTGWTQLSEQGGDNFDASIGKFTAPSDGTYMFSGSIYTNASASGVAGVIIQTDTGGGPSGAQICYTLRPNGPTGNIPSCSGAVYLTAGQAVEMIAYQSSGASATPHGTRTNFSGFKVGGGDTLSGLSCSSGEIPKWDGSAWACAADGGGSGGASSMLPGWPDAIVCSSGTSSRTLYYSFVNSSFVGYRHATGTASDRYVRFDPATGAYSDNVDMSGWDCVTNTWSIADLYAQGRAFNFVGGGSGSGELVAFFAKDSSTNLPAGTWADVVFPTEVLDTGGDNYDPATGKFTAPSDGVYQFSANINFGSLTNERGLIIQKVDPGAAGDNRVCSSYLNSNATATTYAASCSGSIYLTAGDQVEVTARDNPGSNLAGEVRNTFSGFKVGSGGASDTLAGLSCASGEIPKWNGSDWDCALDGGGSGGATTIFSNASGALRYAVFNGVSGATVYKSGGVSDVIRTSAGEYVVKWTTPFANDNYVILGSCNPQNYSGARFSISGNRISGHQYEGVHPSQAGITCRIATSSSNTDSDLVVVVALDLNSPYVEAGATFNGSGGASVYAQKNVSSISRTAAGKYTVTWSTPFPDNKYVVLGSCNGWGTSGGAFTVEGNNIVGNPNEGLKTNSVNIGCRNPSFTDSDLIHVVAVPLGEGFAKKGAVFNGMGGVSNTVYSGVSSVSRVSAGLYDVNWSTPFSSEDYVVLASSNALNTSGVIVGARSKAYSTSSKVQLDGRTSANALADTDYAAVIGFDPTTDDIGEPASSASDTLANLSCNAGEIAKWDGSEWACAADGGGSGDSSIEAGFPDAIACPRTDSGENVFWITNTGTSNEVIYSLSTASDVWLIRFDKATGQYKTSSGGSISFVSAASGHCRNAATTIADLYAAGYAFNLAGGGGSGGGAEISFRATLGSTPLTAAENIITDMTQNFDNGGDNFNPTTGLFTAPAAGRYLFTGTITQGPTASANFYSALKVNGATTTYGTRSQAGASQVHGMTTVNAVYSLAAGDTVGLVGYSGTNLNATAQFAGFQIGGGGSGAPGGADTQVQFNDGGSALGGDAGFTYDKTANALTVEGKVESGMVMLTPVSGAAQPVMPSGVGIQVMTTAQRDALLSPAEGMTIYNSTNTRIEFYTGTIWATFGIAVPSNPDGTTAESAGTSCKSILDGGYSTGDGTYWLDPDGSGAISPFQAYCDMTADGGGWTKYEPLTDWSQETSIHNVTTSSDSSASCGTITTGTDTSGNWLRSNNTLPVHDEYYAKITTNQKGGGASPSWGVAFKPNALPTAYSNPYKSSPHQREVGTYHVIFSKLTSNIVVHDASWTVLGTVPFSEVTDDWYFWVSAWSDASPAFNVNYCFYYR